MSNKEKTMNIKKFAQGSIQFLCLFCLGVANIRPSCV